MLQMVHSQWKYCCNIEYKREEDGLGIKHHEWLKGQVQLELVKGTEKIKMEDRYLVRMIFRQL